MRFLLYGINYSPELTGIGKYSGEMGSWLAAQGHAVRVVTAPPYYPQWQIASGHANRYRTEQRDGVTVYRCPLYVPRTPRTLTRLLHLLSFAFSSFFVLLRLLWWRPQVVFVVAPTLFCLPGAWLYARLTGARLVLHVQDYEVDAMFGLGMVRRGLLTRVAFAIEGWWLRRVDRLSTISRRMMQLAESKGVPRERIFLFPNWVDTDFISPDADRQYYRRLWHIPESTRVVLYSGNMGQKQGLELVVDAARAWRDRTDVLFLMVGQGAARAELEARAEGLPNIRFEPLQPYENLPALLVMADVHLVIQKKGAADIVLPSKLTGILAVGGHALITTEADTELGILIEEFPGIAVRVEPEMAEALLVGLGAVLTSDARMPNPVARRYAEQCLGRDAVLEKFLIDIVSD